MKLLIAGLATKWEKKIGNTLSVQQQNNGNHDYPLQITVTPHQAHAVKTASQDTVEVKNSLLNLRNITEFLMKL